MDQPRRLCIWQGGKTQNNWVKQSVPGRLCEGAGACYQHAARARRVFATLLPTWRAQSQLHVSAHSSMCQHTAPCALGALNHLSLLSLSSFLSFSFLFLPFLFSESINSAAAPCVLGALNHSSRPASSPTGGPRAPRPPPPGPPLAAAGRARCAPLRHAPLALRPVPAHEKPSGARQARLHGPEAKAARVSRTGGEERRRGGEEEKKERRSGEEKRRKKTNWIFIVDCG